MNRILQRIQNRSHVAPSELRASGVNVSSKRRERRNAEGEGSRIDGKGHGGRVEVAWNNAE